MKNVIFACLAFLIGSCAIEVDRKRTYPIGRIYYDNDPVPYCSSTTWYDDYYNSYAVGCLEWQWCSNIQCYQCTWWDDDTEMDCNNNVYYW